MAINKLYNENLKQFLHETLYGTILKKKIIKIFDRRQTGYIIYKSIQNYKRKKHDGKIVVTGYQKTPKFHVSRIKKKSGYTIGNNLELFYKKIRNGKKVTIKTNAHMV